MSHDFHSNIPRYVVVRFLIRRGRAVTIGVT